MEWRRLLEPEIQDFIRRNETADVRQLALKKVPSASWPYPLILDQIKVRQKAKTKTPELYETDGFIFPFGENFEQASSTSCAKYKAGLANGKKFVDLTAGSGIDSYAFCQNFLQADLIERDHQNAELLRQNFDLLKGKQRLECDIRIHNTSAEEYVNQMESVDTLFIDPQRRESGRKGIFDFKSCSPDIISLLPAMMKKSNQIIVKASSVLDIHQASSDLGYVSDVHVVEWQGECKEVLYLLKADQPENTFKIHAVEISNAGQPVHQFTFEPVRERLIEPTCGPPQKYIYEPGPAFQKAGGFSSMAEAFSILKLHKNTQLYTSETINLEFPGKIYEVMSILPAGAENLGIPGAELSLRNFPGTTEGLRKRLKLKENSQFRVFATTLWNGEKKLIICRKRP